MREKRGEIGSTTARILRVISIAVGASSLLFLGLMWSAIIGQWHAAAMWWNVVALAWGLATAGGAIAVGIDGTPSRVRIVARLVAVTYLVVALLRILGQDAPLDPGEVVWFLNVAAIGVTAAAMSLRPTIAIAYLIACGGVVGVVRWLCSPDQSALLGLQNGVQSVAFCAIFLVIALSLVGAGRSADLALAEARRENAAEASRRARRDVAERIDALVHDRVLATLLLAGRARNADDRAAAARSAVDALDALERQRHEGERRFTPTAFVWTAQGLVRDLDPATQFGYELEGQTGDRAGGDRDEGGGDRDEGGGDRDEGGGDRDEGGGDAPRSPGAEGDTHSSRFGDAVNSPSGPGAGGGNSSRSGAAGDGIARRQVAGSGEPGEGERGQGGPGRGEPGSLDAAAREIPGDVGDALTSAMLEALRNSLRHAEREDRPTTRAVHVEAGADRVVVTVLDDGVGFDTARVNAARLGIASSIRGRMQSIGGTAQLVSVVGQGTRVVLIWDRAVSSAASNEAAIAERPWRRRRRVSPLDLDFWIGPPVDEDTEAAIGEVEGAAGRDDATAHAEGAAGRDDATAHAEGAAGRDDATAHAEGAAGRDDAPYARGIATAADATRREARARRRLSRRIQREPLLVFAVLQNLSNVALAVSSDIALALTWQCLAALTLYAVATALAVLPNATPLRIPFAAAVVVATTGVTALMSVIVPADAEYFAWHYGANTLLLLGVALRGRIRIAWIGMLLMLATAALMLPYATFGELLHRFDRNIAVLLVGTIAALALKRTINRTLTIERARDARAAQQAAHAAAAEEQERILRRFEASALPVLREIASDAEAGDATADEARRRAWLGVEADLRDRIRARALDVEPLRGAVQRARARGVHVVVLADAGGRAIPGDELPHAAAWAAQRLDAAAADEVTVRLRATSGGLALTVVGADVAELEIAAPATAG